MRAPTHPHRGLARGLGSRPEGGPPQGVDGEAVHKRGRLAVRRPLRSGVRGARLSALERRRAAPARAAGRPDLGGDQRDPAADRGPRPRAAGRGADHPLGDPACAPHGCRIRITDAGKPVKPPAPTPDPAPLLDPRSIAVVGANDRPGSYGDIVLRNLARAGFAGPVWGVNPRRTEVHGRPCVPSVADLPQPVDAVVVAIPAAGVPDVIRDAAARDCGGAIVISAGFGEIAQGLELERELSEAALAGGLP